MTAPPASARPQALFDELLADPGYLSGERRFPRRLSRDEAADLAQGLAEQVDRGCQARAEVGRKQSLPIVCAVGCNGCCEELVMVYQPEALAVSRWLMRPENTAAREAFLQAYPAWKTATGSTAGQMADCSAKGDRAAYMELHVAHWRKRIMCAFNRDGACSIYPARPLTCRNAHAVETSALCSGANDGTRPAQRLEFAPLDDYLSSANKALRAAHYALGEQRNRPAALCEAVYGQLQALLAAAKKRGRRSE
jgi:Fe-S-cluster containining protein